MNIWLYLFIVVGGILQAFGGPMNAQLYKVAPKPWLLLRSSRLCAGSSVSLSAWSRAPFPRPLPTVEGIVAMPWWAPLGGLVGAVAVYAGLTLVGRVGGSWPLHRFDSDRSPHYFDRYRSFRPLPPECTSLQLLASLGSRLDGRRRHAHRQVLETRTPAQSQISGLWLSSSPKREPLIP